MAAELQREVRSYDRQFLCALLQCRDRGVQLSIPLSRSAEFGTEHRIRQCNAVQSEAAAVSEFERELVRFAQFPDQGRGQAAGVPGGRLQRVQPDALWDGVDELAGSELRAFDQQF